MWFLGSTVWKCEREVMSPQVHRGQKRTNQSVKVRNIWRKLSQFNRGRDFSKDITDIPYTQTRSLPWWFQEDSLAVYTPDFLPEPLCTGPISQAPPVWVVHCSLLFNTWLLLGSYSGFAEPQIAESQGLQGPGQTCPGRWDSPLCNPGNGRLGIVDKGVTEFREEKILPISLDIHTGNLPLLDRTCPCVSRTRSHNSRYWLLLVSD
jgi:hypothetical protein